MNNDPTCFGLHHQLAPHEIAENECNTCPARGRCTAAPPLRYPASLIMELTVARNSDDVMTIRVEDTASSMSFLELRMTPHDLMMALTGRGNVFVFGEVRGLQCVGKKRVVESRSVEAPSDLEWDQKVREQWIRDHCQEEGWILDASLRSRDSTERKGDKLIMHYRVIKYV